MLNERYPGSSSRHDENSWLLHTRKCRELLTLLSLSEWKLSSKGPREPSAMGYATKYPSTEAAFFVYSTMLLSSLSSRLVFWCLQFLSISIFHFRTFCVAYHFLFILQLECGMLFNQIGTSKGKDKVEVLPVPWVNWATVSLSVLGCFH